MEEDSQMEWRNGKADLDFIKEVDEPVFLHDLEDSFCEPWPGLSKT